ncbi:MAG: hypothetical protein HUJ85_06755, partial [Veillonella sp.]|nr:hypothetical protein [Veillonella sp.]
MRRVFILIFCLMSVCAISAQTLNPTQKQLKKEIFSVIKKIGTNLTDDGGEIKGENM